MKSAFCFTVPRRRVRSVKGTFRPDDSLSWSTVLTRKRIFSRSVFFHYRESESSSNRRTRLICQVARCISQLNVQMSRLTCGSRSRSNSFSPSPSRSPSLSSYLSASASPRSGHSPTNNPVNSRAKPKETSPKKMPRKLVRSLTMPSAENSLLPVKVLFPSSNEFEDRYPPPTKAFNLSTKLKSQMLVEFQAKLTGSTETQRTKSFQSSATQGRLVSSAHRLDSLKGHSKKGIDSLSKGAKPKLIPTQPPKDANASKPKTNESVADCGNKLKKSSNAVAQTVTSVLPKKKSKKRHGNKSAEGSAKSDQLLLKVGTFSRVINAMKK